jgi:glucosamine--fructose-6-phosphate aminotransferase (isomerizing)
MCGIIGYVGHRPAQARLLAGLERLEYRGYDSAGICLVEEGRLDIVRAVGKLHRLRERIAGSASPASTGIGHTRWATHGRVTEENAHPLSAGEDEVAIVLNGIVENHSALRQELIADGAQFTSETDAEVVAHLVRAAYDGDLEQAVRAAYRRLEGHFAFIVVHADRPGEMVGARLRCPMLVGVGDGEMFIASAHTAFADSTDRVVALDDHEFAICDAGGVRIVSAGGEERVREVTVVEDDDEIVDRAGFDTYMRKEIYEQPLAIAETVRRNLGPEGLMEAPGLDLTGIDRISIVACGTAYNAGLVGRYAIEEWSGVPCEVEVASEWRHRGPRIDSRTLVVGISQSGETADTLSSLRMARERGARTLAITNSPGSQITREVDAVLRTYAGLEIGVAATKTFTCQVVLLQMLALRLARIAGQPLDEGLDELEAELRALPARVRGALDTEQQVAEIARSCQDEPFFLYLGRHVGVPVAQEGALKLKEITYIPADAYASGEMKHGPIALLSDDTPVLCIATE